MFFPQTRARKETSTYKGSHSTSVALFSRYKGAFCQGCCFLVVFQTPVVGIVLAGGFGHSADAPPGLASLFCVVYVLCFALFCVMLISLLLVCLFYVYFSNMCCVVVLFGCMFVSSFREFTKGGLAIYALPLRTCNTLGLAVRVQIESMPNG